MNIHHLKLDWIFENQIFVAAKIRMGSRKFGLFQAQTLEYNTNRKHNTSITTTIKTLQLLPKKSKYQQIFFDCQLFLCIALQQTCGSISQNAEMHFAENFSMVLRVASTKSEYCTRRYHLADTDSITNTLASIGYANFDESDDP